jgi:hypothetical protein
MQMCWAVDEVVTSHLEAAFGDAMDDGDGLVILTAPIEAELPAQWQK